MGEIVNIEDWKKRNKDYRAGQVNRRGSWLWKLFGGRPMTLLGFAFTDEVGGKAVFYYRDKLGRKWMAADGPWNLFRVRSKNDD